MLLHGGEYYAWSPAESGVSYNEHELSLLFTTSWSLFSEMEAVVVVPVSSQSRWSGSTGNPGYER